MIIEFFSSTVNRTSWKKKWGKRKPGKPKVHRIAYLNVVIIIMIATIFVEEHVFFVQLLRILSKRGRQHQRREARKIFLSNPYILLSISLLWLPCMFLFSLKLLWLQRLLLNETMDVSSWNVGHVLKTAWKWSSWSLVWEQDGTNVSFISHIRVRFYFWILLARVTSHLRNALTLSNAFFLMLSGLSRRSLPYYFVLFYF